MKSRNFIVFITVFTFACFFHVSSAHAALTLTAGNNATTTPGVATSITGFQIVGPGASTTPVKIHVTNGTVSASAVGGVTATGNNTDTLNLSGMVTNLNTALSSLKYTRSSTGTDTLEVALVNSDQIYFPTNGHVYQYVSSSLSWNAAKPAAEALMAYGVPGYLVTITSVQENNFVKARLSGNAWIGASDSASEGNWKWVTGPEAGTSFWSGTGSGGTVGGQYASWNPGEPNDSGSNEDCGEEYVADGTWNDLPCSGSTVEGYVAEFGTDASPPVVVSKNISIVTADVPAITSLSPATGNSTALPSANLIMNFSKTVTTQTGAILIRKTSDDSIVESIDTASTTQVTGSGTATITVDPSVMLPEGTQLYVTVPATAFKDSSNNYFGGILNSTTWSFTTLDITAPVITNLTNSTGSSTASVLWDTNEVASTRLRYSTDLSYSTATAETDTSPRVLSHSVSLSNLVACTLYNYKSISRDASGNTATSTAGTLYTDGCIGSTSPLSATSTPVTTATAATSTLMESGRTFTVATPANVTATSSSVVIQIKGMNADPVLDVLGTPSGVLVSAASIVFDVTALIDNSTVLDSFDVPVTITYHYTDADVVDLDENTLTMYHYHAGSWLPLDNCVVEKTGNTITCTTPSFSTFAIFGSLLSTASRRSSSLGGGTTISAQVANLIAMGKLEEANALKAQWKYLFPSVAQASTNVSTNSSTTVPATISMASPSVRDLTVGMTGTDVKSLQQLLITKGYAIPAGPTSYFFGQTKAALAAYQKDHSVLPAIGYFGPITRTQMKTEGLEGLWW